MTDSLYEFACSCCGEIITCKGPSDIRCLHYLHYRGWASTSMDSKGRKHCCPKCLVKHKEYEPGRPFKQGVVGLLAGQYIRSVTIMEDLK